MDTDAGEIERQSDGAASGLRALGRQVAANPVALLLAAVAVGFLAGMVLTFLETAKREN